MKNGEEGRGKKGKGRTRGTAVSNSARDASVNGKVQEEEEGEERYRESVPDMVIVMGLRFWWREGWGAEGDDICR